MIMLHGEENEHLVEAQAGKDRESMEIGSYPIAKARICRRATA
jgi:hypothetical protein